MKNIDIKSLDLKKELEQVMLGFKWDVKGIMHTDGTIAPIPAESRVVTEIFQSMVIKRLEKWGKEKGIKVDDHAEYARGYPDVALSDDSGTSLIALDIKSARFKKDDKISRMTLGTFDGYFLHPNDKLLNKKTRCYNDYHHHWIIAIIYKWNPKKDTPEMVEIESICVGQKWQFAGKVAGSGDTANMGGIDSLKKLQSLQSEFKTEKEFEEFWREYAVNHRRKRTKTPK